MDLTYFEEMASVIFNGKVAFGFEFEFRSLVKEIGSRGVVAVRANKRNWSKATM